VLQIGVIVLCGFFYFRHYFYKKLRYI